MIRKVVAAAVALGFLGVASGAKALPDEPLTSMPLIYDANNKLVGPYYSGTTFIKINNQIYNINIQTSRFTNSLGLNIYYSEEDCVGEAYYGDSNAERFYTRSLAKGIIVTSTNIYIPNGDPRMVNARSAKTINSSADCINRSISGLKVPVLKKPLSYLGVTFPVRLEAPPAPSR